MRTRCMVGVVLVDSVAASAAGGEPMARGSDIAQEAYHNVW
jgi:hypothetical protein